MTDWNDELVEAALAQQFENVVEALTNGADVNARGAILRNTALIYASSRDRLDIVELLLDKGADINAQSDINYTPLLIAAANGKTEIVKLLLNRGADIDATGPTSRSKTSLQWAREKNHTEIIKLLEEAEFKRQPPKPESPIERLRRQRLEKPVDENFWGLS